MKGDSVGMEERDAGVGRGYRGMTTAERVKGWRLRREATTADHNDMMQRRNDGRVHGESDAELAGCEG